MNLNGQQGWFVPDARMQEILHALSKKKLELTPEK